MLVAIGGVSFGGVGAAVALSETYVDADAYVAPDAAAALAQCLEDDGWDARLLSEAESAAIYEPGDAIVVRIRVRDTELGASGRQVDACRIQIQKETGRSSLPASISGTEDEK
ncbi:hypothetical protein [Streptomyces sp. AC495_CC817]|uniref:hypothetical protein n=1 Tax=Streptomyces sp. AC495_CC817 TaxID=2823900 RepID=UPI001C26FD5B|nr:hypothetical protein [Streptomyces sp. AC495_CC817]